MEIAPLFMSLHLKFQQYFIDTPYIPVYILRIRCKHLFDTILIPFIRQQVVLSPQKKNVYHVQVTINTHVHTN